MADLMWSDPENIESWKRNARGAGWIFGHKVVNHFNMLNGVDLIVRAHQLVQEGYIYWFDNKLVTVWSAPNYCYRMNNKASILSLDERGDREFIVFDTVPESSNSKHYRNLIPYFL
jgi:serine/threonine-protein phosphatase 6 catalytic subunit